MNFKNKNKGFTLIELLVVIAIIGMLSSVVLASLNTARAKSRDARRAADLNQLRIATELFYDKNNTYPSSTDSYVFAIVGLAPTYIPKLPEDPTMTGGNRFRYYYTDMTKGYTLLVQFETDSVTGWCKIVVGVGYTGWATYPTCNL